MRDVRGAAGRAEPCSAALWGAGGPGGWGQQCCQQDRRTRAPKGDVPFKASPCLPPQPGCLRWQGRVAGRGGGQRVRARSVGTETRAAECPWAPCGLSGPPLSLFLGRRAAYMGPMDRGEESTCSLLEVCSSYPAPLRSGTGTAPSSLSGCPLCVTPLVPWGSSGEPFPRERRLLPVTPEQPKQHAGLAGAGHFAARRTPSCGTALHGHWLAAQKVS